MDNQWGAGIPDSAIIMLAGLIMKRCRMSVPVKMERAWAISIIKGLRPAISKKTPLTDVIQSAIGKPARELSLCSACGKSLPIGSLCRTIWTSSQGEHIKCEGRAKYAGR